jgi:hypothetical protein
MRRRSCAADPATLKTDPPKSPLSRFIGPAYAVGYPANKSRACSILRGPV